MSKYLLEFELHGLPKTTNGSHGHWRVAAAERKKWRNAVKNIAWFRRPVNPLQLAKITLTRCSSMEPDTDNLSISFKSVVDGLKDALIILDDKPSIVTRVHLWEKAPRGQGRVRVRVEEA